VAVDHCVASILLAAQHFGRAKLCMISQLADFAQMVSSVRGLRFCLACITAAYRCTYLLHACTIYWKEQNLVKIIGTRSEQVSKIHRTELRERRLHQSTTKNTINIVDYVHNNALIQLAAFGGLSSTTFR